MAGLLGELKVDESLCLEFCNRGAAHRAAGEPDRLPDFPALMEWLASQGVIPSHVASTDPVGVFERAIFLREALFRVLSLRGVGASAEDLTRVGGETARSMRLVRVVPSAGGGYELGIDFAGAEAGDALLAAVSLSAAKLLTSDALARVSVCGNETCGWLFIDQSKNHSRKWCEMESCGNKMKARRHYARKRAAAT